ncbi:CENP-B homolog protein 2-like protein [Tanacetum coccineum]
MTDEIRRALCKHNKDNPSLTQKQLQEWVHSNYGLQVSQATISNTVKRSLEYLSLAPERGDVKRHKPAKFPDLEKSLYEWILQYQEHVNMTGELIIEKAKKFMKDMYPVDTPDFTFSIGWLGKFKARYGIKNFRRFGESGSVEMEGMEDKLKSIRDKVDQFEMKDIFNMDETGLFFRLQPDHSLATMQLEGKKQDKERLTVAICCNEDGSEKLPLWIIGKYAKPRCFKNVNLNSLNCEYRANKRAWMTGVLFEEYVRQLDKKMVGRKILLIVDNCPAHPKIIEGLRNVELFFLPPNTTSKIQPCDAGIIRAFKMHYRRRFYRSLLEGYELGVPNPAKINVLDAMNLAISAWTMDVSANTIANCFRHCKLRSTDNMTFENSDEGGESTQELQNLIKELGYRNAMDVEDVLTHPEENVVAQLVWDASIKLNTNVGDNDVLNFNIGCEGCNKRHKSSGSISFNTESGDANINQNTNVGDNDDDEVHAYERMNRVYNYSLDPCGPVYITIGDGGNIEKIDVDHADKPGKCPSPSDNVPEFGGVCHTNFTSGPAKGKFCWDRQPEWSAYRESSFGHGILEVVNSTYALWTWHRNQDIYKEKSTGDQIYIVRQPDLCLVYPQLHSHTSPLAATGFGIPEWRGLSSYFLILAIACTCLHLL